MFNGIYFMVYLLDLHVMSQCVGEISYDWLLCSSAEIQTNAVESDHLYTK